MPPRSVKMKRFIFGFQRRVWCPKWTPASRSSFMETTGMSAPFSVSTAYHRRRLGGDREHRRPPSTYPSAGSRFSGRLNGTAKALLVGAVLQMLLTPRCARGRREPGAPGILSARLAEYVKVRLELARERRADLESLTAERVREREPGG